MTLLHRPMTRLDNPYFDEIAPHMGESILSWPPGNSLTVARFEDVEGWKRRKDLVNRCAWAIPNIEAIEAVARYGSVVEMGAGTGYWAWLLKQVGVDVIAYDEHPPRRGAKANHWHKDTRTWTRVIKAQPSALMGHADRTLLLCWPPYNQSMAAASLSFYDGETVAYVGEQDAGCTGDAEFHKMLGKRFEETESVAIPQWEGLHDFLSIWRRR